MPRNTNPAWDSAVTAAAAWFTADPPSGWTATAPPPLQAANGGPFDVVQAFRPFVPAKGKGLFVYRDYTKNSPELFEESDAGRYWKHPLIAHILWSFTEPTGASETMEQHLETAIAAVLARIRGYEGNRNFANAFTSVAATADEVPEVRYSGDPYDQLVKDGNVEVKIHFVATDHFWG